MPELQTDKLFETATETAHTEVAHINGKIPEWLRGSFIRIGPGKFDIDNFTMNHWFDGYSIMSKFSVTGDTVKFEKKYLQSDAYKRAVAAKRPVLTEFGTRAYSDPNKSLLSRIVSACLPIELTDNDSINLFQLGSEIFASGETCFFRKIDPSSLGTEEKFDTNKCFGLNVACAHPITDDNGVTYTLGSSVITGLKYNIVKIPAGKGSAKDLMKKSKIIASINSSWTGVMSYNHSFGMSKSWIIFIEQPYVMNIGKAAVSYLKGGHTFSDWLEWRGENFKNRFWLIEKETGKVLKVDFRSNEPFFFLHIINAYEDDGQVVVDLASYRNPDSLKDMNLTKVRNGDLSQDSQASAHRYVIPVITELKDAPENVDLVAIKSTASAVRQGNEIILTPEALTLKGFEMPVINNKFVGKKHKYFYAAGNMDSSLSHTICKCDTKKTSSSLVWRESDYYFPGEPVFIPNPNATAEDDGVIVCGVTDSRHDSSDFLLFLDAKTFKELGRVKFRQHIPLAFHGIFLPQS
ncbi:unnamed protein product [Allacma fusca]|uniref:Carotenoid cleavage dioxygenase n=1 Tax=Allacma fusca TaxID=39272 RepID=A0A8J2JXG7_9HEXA|nr:unnamed protein product [Allacma fusca]